MEETKELTVVNDQVSDIEIVEHLTPLANERRIDMLFRLAEKLKVPELKDISENPERFEKFNKTIFNLMILKTDPRDWVDRNGYPELQSSGAFKIRAAFRIIMAPYYQPIITRYTGLDGNQYRKAEVAGIFFHPELGLHEEIGSRSTENDNFVKDWPDNDLMKCAVANLYTRGLSRLVGIMNLTWDILGAVNPKFKKENAAKIEHVKGSKGGDVSSDDNEGQKKIRRDVWEMCLELAGGDPKKAEDVLEKLGTFTKDGKEIKGHRDINKVPLRSLNYRLSDAHKLYKETFKRPFVYKEEEVSNGNGKPDNGNDGYAEAFGEAPREPGDDGLFSRPPGNPGKQNNQGS